MSLALPHCKLLLQPLSEKAVERDRLQPRKWKKKQTEQKGFNYLATTHLLLRKLLVQRQVDLSVARAASIVVQVPVKVAPAQ